MALDSVTNSTETTEDALSPTTIVLNALRKAGMPITNDNIRRYVSGSMRQTNEAGTDIDGLRIENPGTDQNSKGPQGGPGVGQSGNAASQVEKSNPNTSGYNSGTPDRDARIPIPSAAASADTSSASPQQRTGPQDATDFLTPAAIAAAAIGGGAIPGMMNRGSGAEFVGNAQMPTGSVMDVNPTAIPASNPTLSLGNSAGPMPDVAPQAAIAPPSSMESAMQRAIAPANPGLMGLPAPQQPQAISAPTPQGQIEGAPNLLANGVNPNDPMNIIRQGTQLPAGINPNSIPSTTGPSTTVLPENVQGSPRVPIRPTPPGPFRAMPNMDIIQSILKGLRL